MATKTNIFLVNDTPDAGKKLREHFTSWKLITSAPRDGTEILLKHPHGIVSAWWCREDSEWVCFDDRFKLDSGVTHWAPLPFWQEERIPSEELDAGDIMYRSIHPDGC